MKSQEFVSGTMATMTSKDGSQYVSLNYMTNNYDYTIYTVCAKSEEHTYWAQWEEKTDAVADYNKIYNDLFDRTGR